MSYPTSVTGVPTATSPTTSSSPTTASSASTSNGPTPTTPATTPIATSMTYVVTTLPTTITSTQPYGSITVITTEISTTTPIAVPTPSPVNNSSNTGAIVGGVVGGIAAIALLGLSFFCLRRRRRRNASGGNFDPERIVSHSSGGGTHPQIDLGEDTEVTSLPSPEHDESMRQYGESPFLAAGEGAAGLGAGAAAAGAGTRRTTPPPNTPPQHSGTATFPSGGDPSQAFIRPQSGQYSQGETIQQGDQHTPGPLTQPVLSASDVSSSGHGMKEREAAAEAGRHGLGLPTQQEVDGEGSGVVQHQDAGQALGDEEEPRDVPPAYESIRQ